jgi:hypothetical protein
MARDLIVPKPNVEGALKPTLQCGNFAGVSYEPYSMVLN